MTDEQIKQNAEEYAGNSAKHLQQPYEEYKLRYDAYLAGAYSRDEEIEELKRSKGEFLYAVAKHKKAAMEFEAKFDKLRNPWRDAKKELPEMTEETREYKESPTVFICFDDDTVGVAYYSYSWKRWESRGAGIPTPKYWMPISKLPKGDE